MKSTVEVSILCLAFNHEQYIADAIEGFLSQKTTFPFEIIINEDASTDRTAEIIRDYENRFPDIIKPIYHSVNQYSQGVNINDKYMLPKAKGKYVALCDGDDFWNDPYKLQKQYDAMEENPQCLMCLHKVQDLNVLDGVVGEVKYLPQNKIHTGILSSKQFFQIIGEGDFFNEVCYFFRADEYRRYQREYPEFAQLFMRNKTDDAPMIDYFAALADVYYIDECMAVYRRFTNGSWSNQMRTKNLEEQTEYYKNIIEAQNAFDQFTGGKFATELYCNRQYFKFNYERCLGHYKDMLDAQYECVWKRQSSNYRKRIVLLSHNYKFWSKVFHIYDAIRKIL